MARDEDDDLYDEEFDFVDDDDDDEVADNEESEIDGEVASKERDAAPAGRRRAERNSEDSDGDIDEGRAAEDDAEDEYGRTAPKADYVVHIYEHGRFKRTIDRPFTPEDAEAFASECNRTGKSYGRMAVAGKNDSKPKKTLD